MDGGGRPSRRRRRPGNQRSPKEALTEGMRRGLRHRSGARPRRAASGFPELRDRRAVRVGSPGRRGDEGKGTRASTETSSRHGALPHAEDWMTTSSGAGSRQSRLRVPYAQPKLNTSLALSSA